MKTYSPYDNLEKRDYPAMLVTTSFHDSQVMYWEPAKYVARLRTVKTDHNPLLLKIKMDPAGHGGASGRYDKLKDQAFEYAWMLSPGRGLRAKSAAQFAPERAVILEEPLRLFALRGLAQRPAIVAAALHQARTIPCTDTR